MNNHVFILEFLPNELIIKVFKYFNARHLFRAFYNLNFRFNNIIQSLNHLTYSTNQTDNYITSYPFIYTLIINAQIEDRLSYFTNVRRIILDYVTDDLIAQFDTSILPRLEYLSIYRKVHPYYMPDLRSKIFSNIFPNLKYCYISRMKSPSTIQEWTQSPSIRSVKVNDIDALIYISILSACPNLYFLKFKLPIRSKIQSNVLLHTNLKRLLINMNYDDWPWDDTILKGYLLCVPNLEQFRIRRWISGGSNGIDCLQNYDWLSTIVFSYLPLLYQFQFDLCVNRSSGLNQFDFQDIYHRLKLSFNNVYKSRYQCRLEFF